MRDGRSSKRNGYGLRTPGEIFLLGEEWNLDNEDYYYKADYWPSMIGAPFSVWLSPVTMTIAACRIFLQVVESRIDKLQNMTPNDLIREGYPLTEEGWEQFKVIWNNGRGKNKGKQWRFNIDVEVIKFKVLTRKDMYNMGYNLFLNSNDKYQNTTYYQKNSIRLVKEIN